RPRPSATPRTRARRDTRRPTAGRRRAHRPSLLRPSNESPVLLASGGPRPACGRQGRDLTVVDRGRDGERTGQHVKPQLARAAPLSGPAPPARTGRSPRLWEVSGGAPSSVTARMTWAPPAAPGRPPPFHFGRAAAVAVTVARGVSASATATAASSAPGTN